MVGAQQLYQRFGFHRAAERDIILDSGLRPPLVHFWSCMKIVTDLPRTVRVIENVWIPLADGTRLAAKIWLPEDAEAEPVPAVLECLPYRKGDGTAIRDERARTRYLAGHGYAGVRVDLRGTRRLRRRPRRRVHRSRSRRTRVEVIAWLAEQPWCTGAVGMIGHLLGRLQRAAGGGAAARRR